MTLWIGDFVDLKCSSLVASEKYALFVVHSASFVTLKGTPHVHWVYEWFCQDYCKCDRFEELAEEMAKVLSFWQHMG